MDEQVLSLNVFQILKDQRPGEPVERIFGPLREEKIKMDPRCNTAVVGEPGFERQPLPRENKEDNGLTIRP